MTRAEPRRRALQRGARLERDTAKVLRTRRTATIGSRRREPDVAAIRVNRETLQAECKSRLRLPRVVVDALEQARRYAPGAIAVAVLRERGGRAIVALDLVAFARLLGLDLAAFPTRNRPTKRDPKQLGLPLDVDAPSALTRENAGEAAASASLAPSRVEGGTGAEKGDADGCEDRRRRGAREEPRRHGT